MFDQITLVIEDDEVKYCPLDITNEPIDVDDTRVVDISDIDDGWGSEEAKNHVLLEARKFAGNVTSDVKRPDSFDDLEFRPAPSRIFRPYEPVDTKNETERVRWLEERYFDGKVNFRKVEAGVPVAYFDALRSYRDGNYFAASLASMSVIEKLLCEAAGETHIHDALNWLGDAKHFQSVNVDEVRRLKEIYNSNKHHRQRLTEFRAKEPETRIREYVESGELDRRNVESPEDEDKSVTDQPSHYALFELESEQIIEQMLLIIEESPHTTITNGQSREFRRRSVVFD